MKKNCNGCRALERIYSSFSSRSKCQLNYHLEDVFNIKTGSYIESKPLEECPKPKTVNDFILNINLKKQT